MKNIEKIKKIIEKIVENLFNLIIIFLSILVIIFLYCFVQLNFLKKEYVNIFGYSFFTVETGSMSGTIEIDDIIIVKLGKDVQNNDIITFKEENNIITHRIIKMDAEKITTKGDANNAEDKPISKDNVIGKVVFIFKNIKIWKKVFTTPKVYISLIITLLLFGISFSIKNDNSISKEEKE